MLLSSPTSPSSAFLSAVVGIESGVLPMLGKLHCRSSFPTSCLSFKSLDPKARFLLPVRGEGLPVSPLLQQWEKDLSGRAAGLRSITGSWSKRMDFDGRFLRYPLSLEVFVLGEVGVGRILQRAGVRNFLGE